MIIKKREGSTISLNGLYEGDVFLDADNYYIKTNANADGYVKAVRLRDGEIRTFWSDNEVELVNGYFQLD